MGRLSKEPSATLVRALSQTGIRNFVETGTYRGDSTRIAASLFEQVVTIEIRDDFQRIAKQRCAEFDNIAFVLGDSAVAMPDIVAGLDGPAVFWLDGHAGAGNYADVDDCPVLAELEAIAASPFEHVILIDDARAFVAPPPPPFDYRAWPTLVEVFDAARRRHPYYCVVINDMIICVPSAMQPMVVDFCNHVRPDLGNAKPSGFYALPPEDRLALTREAIREKRTLTARWSAMSRGEAGGWAPRAERAAAWLDGLDSVADIGAATHGLKGYLKPDVRYVPVDCVRVDLAIRNNPALSEQEKQERLSDIEGPDWESVIVADLNADPLPVLNVEAGAALGFFEYIYDPLPLLKQMRQQFGRLVLSYNIVRKGTRIEDREAQAWVSHLTLTALENMFAEAGFAIDSRERLNGRQYLWSLR